MEPQIVSYRVDSLRNGKAASFHYSASLELEARQFFTYLANRAHDVELVAIFDNGHIHLIDENGASNAADTTELQTMAAQTSIGTQGGT